MEFVPFWLRQRDCWFLGVSSWWKINSICVFLNRWMVDFYIFLWDEWLDLVFMVNVLSINIAVPWIQWDWKNGDVVESSILEWSLGNIWCLVFGWVWVWFKCCKKRGKGSGGKNASWKSFGGFLWKYLKDLARWSGNVAPRAENHQLPHLPKFFVGDVCRFWYYCYILITYYYVSYDSWYWMNYHILSKTQWNLANGPLSKLLELLDTQV